MSRLSARRIKLYPAPYLSMVGETRKLLRYTTENFIANKEMSRILARRYLQRKFSQCNH